jgi:enoyl-CoA hydratase
MEQKTLVIEDLGAVRSIRIDRPEKLNALNRQTVAELRAAFEAVAGDAAVRAVLLSGSGGKAFVAGADIAELAQLTAIEARDFSRAGQALMLAIEHLGKPVVAAIGGFALGGGMELAMSCHLRIAADTARMGQPEVNLGLIPGFGGTQRLLRLAGRGAALELCLTGDPVDAARAHALGLVHRVVPAAELQEQALALAQKLAGAAPEALRGVLDAVLVGGECGLQQGLDYETQAFAVCCATEDMREGTRAFLERRKAVFTGK